MVTYSGFIAPKAPTWALVNGSRGRRHDPRVKIDYGVVHLWVSPEDAPERYLRQLNTPALPTSGRTFQSKNSAGQWLWETEDGKQTTDETKAKRYAGRETTVYRLGFAPLALIPRVSPMPWCYGAGYHVVCGIDGEFHFAANPDEIAANHAAPFNDRGVGAVLPGRIQTADQWKDKTSLAELEALAKLMVYCNGRWGIPICHTTPKQMKAGKKGWAGHRDVNDLQRMLKKPASDHGDPGVTFPWAYVIGRAWRLCVDGWNAAGQLPAHVTFWGWGTLEAGQKLLGVPETGVWDEPTLAGYSVLLSWLASI